VHVRSGVIEGREKDAKSMSKGPSNYHDTWDMLALILKDWWLGSKWWTILLSAPLIGLGVAIFYLEHIFSRLAVGRSGDDREDVIPDGATQVPTFYAGELTSHETWLSGCVGLVVATIFGAIHCVAWSSEFRSDLEQLLWRSSLAITSLPLLLFVISFIGDHITDLRLGWKILPLWLFVFMQRSWLDCCLGFLTLLHALHYWFCHS